MDSPARCNAPPPKRPTSISARSKSNRRASAASTSPSAARAAGPSLRGPIPNRSSAATGGKSVGEDWRTRSHHIDLSRNATRAPRCAPPRPSPRSYPAQPRGRPKTSTARPTPPAHRPYIAPSDFRYAAVPPVMSCSICADRARHCQLPCGLPGALKRASLPRLSTSCIGNTASRLTAA